MENEVQKKRILSGIQPSGDLTLGSYLGAIKNWAALADEYDCYYMLADMHTITVRQVPAELRRHTLTQVAAYIASGLDPEKNVLFVQSHVPAHAQLGWVLDCYTMFGELSRMTQFKDKSAKNADNINAGLFTYPALMAADILLYDANLVPVGKDQNQHLEFTRDVAERFNNRMGETFVIPEGLSQQDVMIIPGTDGNKMSKSRNNYIDIFVPEKELKKVIGSIVTDSTPLEEPKNPDTCNVFKLYSLLGTPEQTEDLRGKYLAGGFGYGHAKKALLELILERFAKERELFQYYTDHLDEVEQKLLEGAQKAARVAEIRLSDVRKKLGFR